MSLAGLKIALTGKPKGMSRSEFRTLVSEAGAEYSSSLDGVEFLILGDKPMSSKVEKAKSEEVEILEWEEFQARLTSPEAKGEVSEVPLAYEQQEEMPHPLEVLDGGRRLRILDVSLRRYLAL